MKNKKGFKNLKVVDPANHTSRIDKTPVEVEDLNPFPYIFKTKFDFDFENNYEKIYENMAVAKRLMEEDDQYSKQLADSEYFKDGALTTSHLLLTIKNIIHHILGLNFQNLVNPFYLE